MAAKMIAKKAEKLAELKKVSSKMKQQDRYGYVVIHNNIQFKIQKNTITLNSVLLIDQDNEDDEEDKDEDDLCDLLKVKPSLLLLLQLLQVGQLLLSPIFIETKLHPRSLCHSH